MLSGATLIRTGLTRLPVTEGWNLRDQAGAREYVRKTVEDHLQLIAAMDRLVQDWSDSAAFTTLHRLAARANAAC